MQDALSVNIMTMEGYMSDRPPPIHHWLVFVVVALVACACGGEGQATPPSPDPTPPPPTVAASEITTVGADSRPVPVIDVPHPGHEAGLVGVLRGDPELDGGCLWIANLRTGMLYGIRWPEGFAAQFHPVGLLDEEGRLVAGEGEVLHLAGSEVMGQGLDRCRVSEEVFGTWDVVLASPDLIEQERG